MYVYIYVYVYVYICINLNRTAALFHEDVARRVEDVTKRLQTSATGARYELILMYVCMYVCMHVCVCLCVCVCMYVWVFVRYQTF
jgi:hypothetical protein